MNIIKKAHQEAHECNASQEVHDWIDWFDKEIKEQDKRSFMWAYKHAINGYEISLGDTIMKIDYADGPEGACFVDSNTNEEIRFGADMFNRKDWNVMISRR